MSAFIYWSHMRSNRKGCESEVDEAWRQIILFCYSVCTSEYAIKETKVSRIEE